MELLKREHVMVAMFMPKNYRYKNLFWYCKFNKAWKIEHKTKG